MRSLDKKSCAGARDEVSRTGTAPAVPRRVTSHSLVDALWTDYVRSTPQAERIRHLLTARGEWLQHDHVALRTFTVPGIGNDAVAGAFEELGWHPRGALLGRLPTACGPGAGNIPIRRCPTISISELALGDAVASRRAASCRVSSRSCRRGSERDAISRDAGRPWQLTHADYRALLAESAHAAWLAAFGFRVHHFAVDVTTLSTFPDVVAVSRSSVDHGFALDAAREDASRFASRSHSPTRPCGWRRAPTGSRYEVVAGVREEK